VTAAPSSHPPALSPTARTLPDHLEILSVVKDVGWLSIFLAYDKTTSKRCYAVEIDKNAVPDITAREYERYSTIHTNMARATDEEKTAADKIWHDWESSGKVYQLPRDSPAKAVQNFYVVKGKRHRVVLTFLYVNKKLESLYKTLAFEQSRIEDLLTKLRLYRSHATLDISDAFMCIVLGNNLRLLTDTRVTSQSGDISTYRFCNMPYGVCIAPWVLENCVNHAIGLFSEQVVPKMPMPKADKSSLFIGSYMDDILVASDKDAIGIINKLKEILRSLSFEVADHKVMNIDKSSVTEILGLTIIINEGSKVYTVSDKKDAKWKMVLSAVHGLTDITYQDILKCIGSIPKYNVYSPWLTTLSNKIQSVASREKSQVHADWCEPVSPPLRDLIKRWIVFAIDHKPVKVPLDIYPESKLSIFVDASKWAMGFIVYQRHGDSDVVIHRENTLFPPNRVSLNISFKEMIALRYALSWTILPLLFLIRTSLPIFSTPHQWIPGQQRLQDRHLKQASISRQSDKINLKTNQTVALDDIENAQQNDPRLPQDDEHYTVINGIVHRKTPHGYPLPYIPPDLR
ncbi:hypothetical protein FOZ62_000944, partial [Perkinsus olseni]